MNGSHLLHLLSEHGYNLNIDLVSAVFEISGFSTILDVFTSEEDALQGF